MAAAAAAAKGLAVCPPSVEAWPNADCPNAGLGAALPKGEGAPNADVCCGAAAPNGFAGFCGWPKVDWPNAGVAAAAGAG